MDLSTGPVIGGAAPGAGQRHRGQRAPASLSAAVPISRLTQLHRHRLDRHVWTSANGTHGIDIQDSQNNIGVGAPNLIAFNGTGLGHAGITLTSGANQQQHHRNLIYTNSGPGVYLTQTVSRNRVSENSIFDNGHRGHPHRNALNLQRPLRQPMPATMISRTSPSSPPPPAMAAA